MLYSMGAVLHFRICKGCVVHHSHSHSHSGDNGGHSHAADGRHSILSDDELLPVSVASSNGYRPLLSDGPSDVELLVNGEDGDRQPLQCEVQREHRTTNVNIRAAMVHVIGDLIQSVGVFTAAIVVLIKVCYGYYWFASASLANPYCQSTWMCVCLCVCVSVCLCVRTLRSNISETKGARGSVTIGSL